MQGEKTEVITSKNKYLTKFIMNRFFLKCIGFYIVLLTGCESVTQKTEEVDKAVRDTVLIPIEASRKKTFYVSKSKILLDSTLNKSKVFSRFKTSVEGLKKLDPEGIEFYLKGAIKSTEDLLNEVLIVRESRNFNCRGKCHATDANGTVGGTGGRGVGDARVGRSEHR